MLCVLVTMSGRALLADTKDGSPQKQTVAAAKIKPLSKETKRISASLPKQTTAAEAPAVHWGTFILNGRLGSSQGRATKALADIGCTERSGDGSVKSGRKGAVTILVICTPVSATKTSVCVVASSPDSRAAELLRNDIRTRIQKMIEFD